MNLKFGSARVPRITKVIFPLFKRCLMSLTVSGESVKSLIKSAKGSKVPLRLRLLRDNSLFKLTTPVKVPFMFVPLSATRVKFNLRLLRDILTKTS